MTTIQVRTTHGDYTGRSVASIVRREYGRNAELLPDSGPRVATIAKKDRSGWTVLGSVLSVRDMAGRTVEDWV